MPTGEIKNSSDWRSGFLFLGNQLALDFLNTCPLQNGKRTELLPEFKALLRWFVAAGLINSKQANNLQREWGRSVRAARVMEMLHRLREKWRKTIDLWQRTGTLDAATVQELNLLMEAHPVLHRLRASAAGGSVEVWFAPRQPEDFSAPLAYSAARLFVDADRGRVRKCLDCVLYFHDTSKKGTRRWCSMRLCGNRRKVAAYAARHRSTKKTAGRKKPKL